MANRGFFHVAKWMLTRRRPRWIGQPGALPGPAPPERAARGELRVTFIGHATTLIQFDGINILTDPIWSERCSPIPWAGPRRARPPGVRWDDLPPIDAVLLSHNHYDHCDLPTLRRLAGRGAPRILAAEGLGAFLRARGFTRAEDLPWWASAELSGGARVVAVPAQHWSGRGLFDRAATHWCGFMIESGAGRIYFAGDTGFGPHFGLIRGRLGAPRLAILPIGAHLPRWFMAPVHLSPAEAVEAHHRLGARVSVAAHFGTFPLADDGESEAAEELRRALAERGTSESAFWMLDFGEGRDVPD